MPWSDPLSRQLFLESLFLHVTYLGSSLGLVVLLALYGWWVSPRDARRAGLVLGASFLLNILLKGWLGLPRPYELEPELASEQAVGTGGGGGFPSGHTQNTTVLWLTVAFRHPRRPLYAAAILMVALVAYSRIFLGVHFVLDVLGGLAIGLVLAWLGARLPVPPPPRGAPAALLVAGGLGVAWVAGAPFAPALGFTAGCLLARPGGEPAATLARKLFVALGGLGLLVLLFFALRAAGDLLWAAAPWLAELDADGTSATFLLYLLLAWTGLDRWPRWALRRPAKTAVNP